MQTTEPEIICNHITLRDSINHIFFKLRHCKQIKIIEHMNQIYIGLNRYWISMVLCWMFNISHKIQSFIRSAKSCSIFSRISAGNIYGLSRACRFKLLKYQPLIYLWPSRNLPTISSDACVQIISPHKHSQKACKCSKIGKSYPACLKFSN